MCDSMENVRGGNGRGIGMGMGFNTGNEGTPNVGNRFRGRGPGLAGLPHAVKAKTVSLIFLLGEQNDIDRNLHCPVLN